ncbi:MAG TPA: hypothetical protein VLH40_06885 [Atribacteraceae bacterium]|nr:hypothetical protein [Atribacteraceae bacterium]
MMAKRGPHTPEEAKLAIEAVLGRPVVPVIWERLCREKYVDEFIQGFLSLKGFRVAYQKNEAIYQAGQQAAGGKFSFPERKEEASDTKDITFSEVLAAGRSRLPYVKAFRREVLGGVLLTPDQALSWLFSQADKREIAPGSYPVVTHNLKGLVGAITDPAFDNFYEDSRESASVPFIQEGVSGNALLFFSNGTDKLKRLADVANFLTNEGFWKLPQAVDFVLTGRTPLIPAVRYGWPQTQLKGLPLPVSLTVDVRMSPQALAKEYSKIRKRLLGNRHIKPLTPKASALAIFTAKKEGLSWQGSMQKWNEQYPQWTYTHYRNFCRDGLMAKRRVLDEDRTQPAQKKNGP